jgi:hypothetical protein
MGHKSHIKHEQRSATLINNPLESIYTQDILGINRYERYFELLHITDILSKCHYQLK